MANGILIPQAQQMQMIQPTLAKPGPGALESAWSGLMGGVETGLKLNEYAQQIQARKEEKALKQAQAQAAAEQQTITQQLAMGAAQGDPNAMAGLWAMDPETARYMEQAQREQAELDIAQAEAEAAERGRQGNLVTSAKGERKRDAMYRIFDDIRNRGLEPTRQGIPTRQEIANMSIEEIDNWGKQRQTYGMTPQQVREQQLAEMTPDQIKGQSDIGKIQADVESGLITPKLGAKAIDKKLRGMTPKATRSKEERELDQYIELSVRKDQGKKLSSRQEKRFGILNKKYGDDLQTTGDIMSHIANKVIANEPLTKGEKSAYQLLRDPIQLLIAQSMGGIQEEAEALQEPAPTSESAPAQSAATPTTANETRITTADGKIAIYDSVTRQFLRYE